MRKYILVLVIFFTLIICGCVTTEVDSSTSNNKEISKKFDSGKSWNDYRVSFANPAIFNMVVTNFKWENTLESSLKSLESSVCSISSNINFVCIYTPVSWKYSKPKNYSSEVNLLALLDQIRRHSDLDYLIDGENIIFGSFLYNVTMPTMVLLRVSDNSSGLYLDDVLFANVDNDILGPIKYKYLESGWYILSFHFRFMCLANGNILIMPEGEVYNEINIKISKEGYRSKLYSEQMIRSGANISEIRLEPVE